MPSRPPRVCNRCRKTTPAGQRCECMPRPAWQSSNGYTGSGSTRRWRTLRLSKLRATPMCEQCGRLASEVDHIINIAAGGKRYAWTNLQSLCKPCHAAKTAREAATARWNDDPPPF